MPSFLQQLMAQLAGTGHVALGPIYDPPPGTLNAPGGDLYGMIPFDNTQGGMAAEYLGANNRGLGPMGGGAWSQGLGLGGYGQFNPSAILDPSQVQLNPAGWYPDAPRGLLLPPSFVPPSPVPSYDPIDPWAPGAATGYPWGLNWDFHTILNQQPYPPPR